MHEFGLIKGIVETALVTAQSSGAARITALNVVMYDDGHTNPEALTLYFDTLTHGTLAENARLNFDNRACEWKCWSCGQLFASASHDETCPRCGSPGLRLDNDHELYLESIEVE